VGEKETVIDVVVDFCKPLVNAFYPCREEVVHYFLGFMICLFMKSWFQILCLSWFNNEFLYISVSEQNGITIKATIDTFWVKAFCL